MNPINTSLPTPQITNGVTPVPQSSPDIAGYIKAAQQQGISGDDIYGHLKQLGYVDDQGNITSTKQIQKSNEFPAENALEDIRSGNDANETDITKGAVKQGISDLASAGAQNAGPVGADMLAHAPAFAEDINDLKKAVTPSNKEQEIGASNTKVAEGAIPTTEAGSAIKDFVEPVITDISSDVKSGADVVKSSINSGSESLLNKAKDIATPAPPLTMQTLIDRVKGIPEQASSIADATKKYIQSAKDTISNTGAKTPLDLAAGQFKSAMQKLRANMGDAGEAIKTSLAPVANSKASGINEILENLKNKTGEDLGAEYTPMADSSGSDPMKGMNFEQRTGLLNDVLDGKAPSPFGNEEGMFRPLEGREMGVTDSSDLKALGDLHETLANLGDTPTVQKLNDTVNRLQGTLYKARQIGAQPMDSQIKGLIKSVSGQLNEAAKTAAGVSEKAQGIPEGTYANANSKYSELARLQDDMSRRLGSGYKNGPSLIKSIFSPQNRGLNTSIAALEKETGVPIFDHATMADFAMRVADDPRIRSLLEESTHGVKAAKDFKTALNNLDITKPATWVKVVSNPIIKALNDPVGKVMRQLGTE